MGKMQLRQEALRRQGASLHCDGRTLQISGGSSQAAFESGSEGLVQLATDIHTGEKFRIKCFWEPHEVRRRRSASLVQLELANLAKTKADALGGAPFEMLREIGPCTPFAVVMKNVRGENWRKLRDRAKTESQYPPGWWPAAATRATWAYGLATAVMKMEARGFIHADLSPGNVVVNDGLHGVTDAGENADTSSLPEDESGDMALVDFDRYLHADCELPDAGQGSEGYAAPEIWDRQAPSMGSDRTALAILIQEFLVAGDADLNREGSLDWFYDQETRALKWSFAEGGPGDSQGGRVHALVARKYPAVAKLVDTTLSAAGPETRPKPESWRPFLRDIAAGRLGAARVPLRSLVIESGSGISPALRIVFGAAKDSLDLSETPFGIRASLERRADGSIALTVHTGANLAVRLPGSDQWTQYSGGDRIGVEIGMVISTPGGKSNARFERPK
jgi:serine/threonine protein kinase